MAGSMNMRLMQFLPLDLAGASLYISVYFGAGFLFSDSLGLIAKSYAVFGNTLGWTIALLFAGYIGYRGWLMFRARKLRPVPRIAVSEVARRLHELTIYDARSHGIGRLLFTAPVFAKPRAFEWLVFWRKNTASTHR